MPPVSGVSNNHQKNLTTAQILFSYRRTTSRYLQTNNWELYDLTASGAVVSHTATLATAPAVQCFLGPLQAPRRQQLWQLFPGGSIPVYAAASPLADRVAFSDETDVLTATGSPHRSPCRHLCYDRLSCRRLGDIDGDRHFPKQPLLCSCDTPALDGDSQCMCALVGLTLPRRTPSSRSRYPGCGVDTA